VDATTAIFSSTREDIPVLCFLETLEDDAH